jgi:hypothetical protein
MEFLSRLSTEKGARALGYVVLLALASLLLSSGLSNAAALSDPSAASRSPGGEGPEAGP